MKEGNMEIVILSPEEVDFKEKDVQSAFEKDLSKLEDSLEFIQSEVVVGTGRIDTLAFDADGNQPVFIEYKRRGQFGKDALIQLMEYLSWFAKDENRLAILEKIIRQHKTDITEFEPRIRLICVVTDIDEQVRNAIYAIANHVKVFSYMVALDTAKKTVLVPKLEIDNNEVESQIPGSVTEMDILNKHPHLLDVFNKLKPHLVIDGVVTYTRGNSFRYKRGRLFAKLRFRQKYIQLELRVGKGAVKDADFKYWRQGESPWGYTYIYPSKGVSDKLAQWIAAAQNLANESETEEEDENQS
jgi:hypothetical protein